LVVKLRSRLTYANVGVTVALVLAGTGLAVASSPGRGAVISTCYRASGGGLRVIDTARKGSAGNCSKKEKALSWNQQGPQGVRGVPGLQGTPGVQGAQGLQGVQGMPGPTFGVMTVGTGAPNPPANPDESSASARNVGRHFAFTLPADGKVYIRFTARDMSATCSPSGIATAGLYLDGAPVPKTLQTIAATAPGLIEFTTIAAVAAGPHAAEVRDDCPVGNVDVTTDPTNSTWTALLLGG
jgi:hypothetical protein